MRTDGPRSSILAAIWQAVIVLVVASLGAHLAWELLAPILPGLMVLLALIAVISFILPRR